MAVCNAARQDLAAGYKPGKMQSTEKERKRKNMKTKENAEAAAVMIQAIRKFNENPEALENLRLYLENHFDIWMEKFAYNPLNLSYELKMFSEIE